MPDTEAGRALARRMDGSETWMADAIDAIERQAAARALAKVRERVEAEHEARRRHFGAGPDEHVGLPLSAVLAAIEEASRG